MSLPLRLMLLAFGSSIAFSMLFIQRAEAWGFVDKPGARKVHIKTTPRTGGLAMISAGFTTVALAVTLGWMPMPDLPWQTWLAGLGFMTMGGLDDRFTFHPKRKILILLLLAAIASWPWTTAMTAAGFSGVKLGHLTFFPAPWMAFPILTFWFMAVPNAVNIEDAINGYMGGFTVILLLTTHASSNSLLIGLLIGFLALNWPRAKHFMGDAGSFGCGFILAEVLLRAGSLTTPLSALILTAPISLDVAMGLIRRRRLGMGLLEPDQLTCPHRLLALLQGAHGATTALLWINTAIFATTSAKPWLAGIWAAIYSTCLFILNRKSIFIHNNT